MDVPTDKRLGSVAALPLASGKEQGSAASSAATDERLASAIGAVWDLIEHADAMEAQHPDYHTEEGPRRSQPLTEAVAAARTLEQHRLDLLATEEGR